MCTPYIEKIWKILMKIKIQDREIELKYTMRSMLMYENITDKTFNPKTMTDIVIFMYCIVISSAKDYSLNLDDFIDYLDENQHVFEEFGEWINKVSEVNNQIKKN